MATLDGIRGAVDLLGAALAYHGGRHAAVARREVPKRAVHVAGEAGAD